MWRLLCGLALSTVSLLAWSTESQAQTFYVTNHGWHTGVVVPASAVTEGALSFVSETLGSAPYYEFGWGDENYYQDGEGKPWLLVSAALWPTSSVMHAVALPAAPEDYFPDSDMVTLTVTDNTLDQLVVALVNSFSDAQPGPPQAIGEGLYGNSRFFPASGKFHLHRTCNTWTLEMLASAGLPVDPEGVIRAPTVMSKLRELIGQ